MTLEFDAPDAADLLADQSLTAPPAVAEPPAFEPTIAQDLAAPIGVPGSAEVALVTEVLHLQGTGTPTLSRLTIPRVDFPRCRQG